MSRLQRSLGSPRGVLCILVAMMAALTVLRGATAHPAAAHVSASVQSPAPDASRLAKRSMSSDHWLQVPNAWPPADSSGMESENESIFSTRSIASDYSGDDVPDGEMPNHHFVHEPLGGLFGSEESDDNFPYAGDDTLVESSDSGTEVTTSSVGHQPAYHVFTPVAAQSALIETMTDGSDDERSANDEGTSVDSVFGHASPQASSYSETDDALRVPGAPGRGRRADSSGSDSSEFRAMLSVFPSLSPTRRLPSAANPWTTAGGTHAAAPAALVTPSEPDRLDSGYEADTEGDASGKLLSRLPSRTVSSIRPTRRPQLATRLPQGLSAARGPAASRPPAAPAPAPRSPSIASTASGGFSGSQQHSDDASETALENESGRESSVVDVSDGATHSSMPGLTSDDSDWSHDDREPTAGRRDGHASVSSDSDSDAASASASASGSDSASNSGSNSEAEFAPIQNRPSRVERVPTPPPRTPRTGAAASPRGGLWTTIRSRLPRG
ncbi:hypothetical protein CXG81DRAFT_17487 [Caulochytrium protostelioides]|uniref:Uncharacterized protein n=1 Tax=Caulochytrium protostelioides TaxID=1555241 RepID=A0A4P9WT02_9FUNG|nr:hypothetical protein CAUPRSCDRAFT_11919 [Caulochytrium protostelioides]RKP02865.1 hypothetical protein CXG81DRAFT_17487 [Caulochytrium protostelioides]|eukprot:RKP02865.1 hypothetical protein CXG81DRAFT_17487 [Caulochytrium protostelioides]